MLSDQEIGLLFEIYEITFRDYTVVSGGSGQSRLMPDLFSAGKSIRDALLIAIDDINANPSHVERVQAILVEFEQLSLDPSKIDSSGYSLRPDNNLRAIRERLYTYTGVLFLKGGNFKINIG